MAGANCHISIPKTAIAALPIVSYSGRIELVDTPEMAAKAVEDLERYAVIGFDTETRPSFKKGHPNNVALMQLATYDCCYLFRLNKIGFPQELCRLIENDSLLKIGLSVHDDFHVMHRNTQFQPSGFVELQTLVKEFGIDDTSLQKIFAIVFNKKISKSQRLTNWEAERLTPQQQVYAATDAWACLKIYDSLTQGIFLPQESPYRILETPFPDNSDKS